MPQLVDVVPGSREWLAARRAGVTATDIVTILGLSSYDSVYSLFWKKLGQVADPDDTERWALGRHMEPFVIDRFEQVNDNLVWPGGLFRNDERAWQLATPDRTTGLIMPTRFTGVLECKSWADADKASWEGGPPPAVRAQLLWQMDTLDVSTGYWAVVFLPSGRFEHGTIEHDHADAFDDYEAEGGACSVCSDLATMRHAGEEFYRRLTLELPPPDPDSSAATLAALRARFSRAEGKQAEVDGTLFAAWSDARDCMDQWETVARGYEIELRAQAAEAQVLTVDGEVVARRVVSDAQVKAHTRHMDYYRRVKPKGDGDGSET